MQDIASIIPRLCTWISKQTGYVRHLKNNVDALMEEALRLRARCEDIENAGREASGGRQRLTNEARTWLDQARRILGEIDSIKLQFDQRRTFCNGCSPYLCSDYTLGRRAFKKLEPVRRFINNGSRFQLLAMFSSPSVVERDVRDLMKEAKTLEAQCDDMESEGREASRKRMRLTIQAQIWLGQAQAILTEIENIKSEFDRRQAFNDGVFPDLLSTSTLGKRAVEKLKSVQRHMIERSSIQLVAMSSPPRVMEMDVPTVCQSSAQRNLDKIWDLLHDKNTSVISIYGMGGIGKTTLMKSINNKLKAANEFDYVIWVTLSKQPNLENIQMEIMSRLHLKFDKKDPYQDRSRQLREWLSNKRYVLILDDLWNSFNLSEVGIPTNKENGSKIAITTRIANMSAVQFCSDLKAEKIKIETLTKEEAWDLFAANVGEEVLHQPDIKDVANDVVMECGGLPLAIVVVAKAMKGQNKKELWQDALRALRASAPEIEGMEPQVLLPLKLSYEDLRDEKVKMCFLYCSLFPEDHEISVKRLIRWWIMEGFIDNVNNLVDASNKGHRIIEELKRRCLLDEGIRADGVCVKMHDIIRDLALYIASSSCNEGQKFLVNVRVGLNEPPPEGTWREFERISLMMNGITELPIKPECPNLISLFLSYNPITAVPHGFVEFMPALQVLDLSYTSITSLSVSSSSLLNLRALILTGCRKLTEVPFLGQLKELQFLDIKSSRILLPKEMQNLVKLKQLNMSKLLYGSLTIPSNIMSRLSSLEDLRMLQTKVNWARGSEFAVENDVKLGEVGNLKRLTILKVTIEGFDCVEDDAFLQQLPNLKRFEVEIGFRVIERFIMKCMKKVYICGGGNNYPHGVKVMVTHTEGLGLLHAFVKDVSQLVVAAKGLRMLCIGHCKKMECILDWSDVGSKALQNIEKLHLVHLSSLQKLFKGEAPQICLRNLNKIHLFGCENLKSLFSSKMVQNLDQLQFLHVINCIGLEEIIEGDDKSLPENPFPKLCNFTLKRLPKLKSIVRCDTLALPSLIELTIHKCPNLRLPKRPDTTDWPSITEGDATWQANP